MKISKEDLPAEILEFVSKELARKVINLDEYKHMTQEERIKLYKYGKELGRSSYVREKVGDHYKCYTLNEKGELE